MITTVTENKPLHAPIMLQEIVNLFSEKAGPKEKFLDATFGRGGHTKELLRIFPTLSVTAIDQDPEAIEYGKSNFKDYIKDNRLQMIHSNFAKDCNLGETTFDGILMDLGVSSPQLDTASRGFSFYNEGPLDMRMDPHSSLTAADIVNTYAESDIADILYHYGDVKKSYRVARVICEKRKEKPFETTKELADLIAKTLGWKKSGHHPATACFQAIRIAVNDEIRAAQTGIENLSQKLSLQGRMFIITFHSIEDRMVKRLLLKLPNGKPLFKKVIIPTDEEQERNPRSRSAKLRVFERTEP